MTRRSLVIGAIVVLTIAGGWWLITRGRPPASVSGPAALPGGAGPSAPADARKITATLYYVSEDGMSLVGVQREVPYGEGVLEQARQIVTAQLTTAPAPLVSAIPQGVALRALYVTERGDAFVDLSAEVRTMHTGGALDELFTVYSIVNAMTANLPAVTRVQILIAGKEVDTLAGHVDLRHPLQKNMTWVKADADSRAPNPEPRTPAAK
jgi:spore germination protein GerM